MEVSAQVAGSVLSELRRQVEDESAKAQFMYPYILPIVRTVPAGQTKTYTFKNSTEGMKYLTGFNIKGQLPESGIESLLVRFSTSNGNVWSEEPVPIELIGTPGYSDVRYGEYPIMFGWREQEQLKIVVTNTSEEDLVFKMSFNGHAYRVFE